ncbi:NAD(P)-dependent oxidoreductase [Candidatus Bathyarchaeota archaeon]|nr:NAD(P)-dependent oxidoreductase [Candidatus Bathyarchaeota archaeon]
MTRIGFIGLGVMGKHMARNLIKAGFTLTIWNRTRSKMNDLIDIGATAAASPRVVAEKSDVIVTMVSDSPDVESVVLGDNGVIEGSRKGQLVIDMSTISPDVTRSIAARLSEKEVDMLDAPVSGGEAGARDAALSIMVGGPRNRYEEAQPVLKAMGKRITYMGGNGMGQTAKLCNQVICALNIQAVCEGLMLGASAGLDLNSLLEVVTAGAANSWQLSNLGPKMVKRDFTPGFRIRHQLKDIRLALATAEGLKLPLPATGLVQQLFRAAEAEGLGEQGTQALIAGIEEIAGHLLR